MFEYYRCIEKDEEEYRKLSVQKSYKRPIGIQILASVCWIEIKCKIEIFRRIDDNDDAAAAAGARE